MNVNYDPSGNRLADLNWFKYTMGFMGWMGLTVILFHALTRVPVFSNVMQVLSLSLIAAVGAFMPGAGLGFLFGIPRTLQEGPRRDPENGSGISAVQPARNVQSNTNLERVSDWMTGMVVGAGLVELSELKLLFLKLADSLAAGLADAPARLPAEQSFAIFLLGYFPICGFLVGYIVTRRFLPRTFATADRDAQEQARHEKSMLGGVMRGVSVEIARQFKNLVVGAALPALKTILPKPGGQSENLSELVPDKPAAAELEETEVPETGSKEAKENPADTAKKDSTPVNQPQAEAQSIKEKWASDPNKGKFGGQAMVNGRQLTATVEPLSEGESEYFRVILKVAPAGAGAPLLAPVEFHLHPTFPKEREMVSPQNGAAGMELICWGSFTVGAVTDGGSTRLELDLAEVPGVPEYFKER